MVTGEGTLYPLLSRLQKDGRVASSWRDSDTGGPPRKYYSVTAKGRRALGEFTAEWSRFRDTVDHILVKATT
jgi:PadR family transcriptional regulator PadR